MSIYAEDFTIVKHYYIAQVDSLGEKKSRFWLIRGWNGQGTNREGIALQFMCKFVFLG